MLRKIVFLFIFSFLTYSVDAYQVNKAKELGTGEARNQNMDISCTTTKGDISKEVCILRRYVKCVKNGKTEDCSSWKAWRNVHAPLKEYSTWRAAAEDCCQAKGLR